jgi:hypothetical protein
MHDFGAAAYWMAGSAASQNSLLGPANSLLAPEKFPARERREFGREPLNFLANSKPKTPFEGKKSQIPC